MTHIAWADVGEIVTIQPGSVVSRVIHRDDQVDVTIFGFAAGEGLTEHTTSRTALVEVVRGRLRVTADGEDLDAGPGFWLQMAPGCPHSIAAREDSIMLLTLVRPADR